jgi:hypothetical protein
MHDLAGEQAVFGRRVEFDFHDASRCGSTETKLPVHVR